MSKRPARPNAFNGEARATAQVSHARAVLEKYLEDHAGKYSAEELAKATGLDVATVRKKMPEMTTSHLVVSSQPRSWKTTYQHRQHWARENRIQGSTPIRNSTMENGTTNYWRKHMTAVNTPPREA